MQRAKLLWEQELYVPFKYNAARAYFHTFPAEVSHSVWVWVLCSSDMDWFEVYLLCLLRFTRLASTLQMRLRPRNFILQWRLFLVRIPTNWWIICSSTREKCLCFLEQQNTIFISTYRQDGRHDWHDTSANSEQVIKSPTWLRVRKRVPLYSCKVEEW